MATSPSVRAWGRGAGDGQRSEHRSGLSHLTRSDNSLARFLWLDLFSLFSRGWGGGGDLLAGLLPGLGLDLGGSLRWCLGGHRDESRRLTDGSPGAWDRHGWAWVTSRVCARMMLIQ